MDALLVLAIVIYFTCVTREEEVIEVDLEVRLNPNFTRDDNAFMKIYNDLIGGQGNGH